MKSRDVSSSMGIATLGATVAAVLTIGTSKVLASTGGPAVVAAWGLVNGFAQTVAAIATLGGGAAAARTIAMTPLDRRPGVARQLAAVVGTWGLALGVAGLLAAGPFAGQLLPSLSPGTSLARLALLAAAAVAFSMFGQGLLSGISAVREIAVGQTVGGALLFALAFPVAALARGHALWAIPVAIGVAAAARGLVFRLSLRRHEGWPKGDQSAVDDAPAVRRSFVALGAVLIVSGTIAMGAPWVAKVLISRSLGLTQVAYLEASLSLSGGYLALLLAGFTSFYMPRLAGAATRAERAAAVGTLFRLALPVAVVVAGVLSVLKPLVIRALFSPAFAEATSTVRWMLVGDAFRLVAHVFASPAVAAADKRTIVTTEVGWAALFLIGGTLATARFRSAEAFGFAYAVAMALYLAFYWRYARVVVGWAPSAADRAAGAIAFAGVLLTAALAWDMGKLELLPALAGLATVGLTVSAVLFLARGRASVTCLR